MDDDLLARWNAAFADDPEHQRFMEIVKSQPPVAPIERETETPFERLLELIDDTYHPLLHMGKED